MNPALNIVKEDSRLPDYYDVEIFYHDKTSDRYSIVGHGTVDGILSILTTDNLYKLIPVNAIRKIEMDKNYSIIKQLHDEKKKEVK